MAKRREHASAGNPSGVCEKLFNAFGIGPAIRPLRSLTFRQQQGSVCRADAGPKAAAAGASPVPPPPPRPRAGKVDVERVPALPPKRAKDINDKVEDYINQTKIRFRGSSHYAP